MSATLLNVMKMCPHQEIAGELANNKVWVLFSPHLQYGKKIFIASAFKIQVFTGSEF